MAAADGAAYAMAVFLVGFILGVPRVLFIAPQIGARLAELAEMPLMLVASWKCSKAFCARHYETHAKRERRPKYVGIVALAVILALEITLGKVLTERTVWQLLVLDKDPISGPAYFATLLIFALLPTIQASMLKPQPAKLI
eukprot:6212464-Pleurochrysis_carterae.AAC.3